MVANGLGILPWAITFFVITAGSLIEGIISGRFSSSGGPSIDWLERQFSRSLATAREVPFGSRVTSHTAFRTYGAIGFGLVVATVDQLLDGHLYTPLGVADWLAPTLSLTTVLLPCYWVSGYRRLRMTQEPTHAQRLGTDALLDLHVPQVATGPAVTSLIRACARVALSALVRSVGAFVISFVLDTELGGWALLAIIITAITVGEYVLKQMHWVGTNRFLPGFTPTRRRSTSDGT